MTAATWWAYEARRCGRQAVILPLAAALLAYLASTGGPGTGMLLGRTLLSCALPAATALACAAVVAREPALELHQSLPTPYPLTVARRLSWPAMVTAFAAVALVTLLSVTGDDSLDPGAVLLELAGLTVLLSGAAVWATVRSGSPAPATGLVVAAVLAKLLLLDRVLPEGAGQALPELLVGALLTARALKVLEPGARLGRTADPRVADGGM
ncbi:hypothetical protein [Streptomyces sp. HD]|uniref:hypothetical protein n=1 Tax=Streptomyces sp. HD TaxID=3020892 RepID=UPI00232BFC4B|nr:hypothetical protein [Streptomyces sp. HD]MDC0772902.1 hypothetical protein [Streptomyces sp. HD]